MARRRQYGTIRKLPSGRYQARRWNDGVQVAAPSTFATKAQAGAWLASVETDVLRGEYYDPTLGQELFGTYAQQWLEHKAGLRPHTRETYESQLKPILEAFGSTPLGKIDTPGVRTWHSQLQRSGRHSNTVAKAYRLLRSILSTAIDDGLIRSNPCHIKGAAVEAIVERPALTWGTILTLADAIHPRFRALILTAALTGLRYGELTGLARQHVDLDRKTIEVDRALGFVKGQGPSLGPPKTISAYRSVAVPATGVTVLDDHLRDFVPPGRDALVFTSLQGRPLLNRYFAPFWARAKAAASVEEDVRFHDLRHFAGTSAATAGASLKEIKARMGQSSNDAAVRYLKAAEARDHEIADAIDRRLAR